MGSTGCIGSCTGAATATVGSVEGVGAGSLTLRSS